MQVKDLMTTQVVSVRPETPVSEVADILHERGFAGVPVVNEAGTTVGLITERELFSSDSKVYLPSYIKLLQETHFVIGGHKALPYAAEQITRTTAADIMNQNIFFASPEMGVDALAEVFAQRHLNPIPVTDSANKLLGIVSRSDLIKLLISNPNETSLPKSELAAVSTPTSRSRPIDDELFYVSKDLNSRFAYVAKARANIWLTTAVVLFVVGFVAGVIYVADPTVFTKQESQVFTP